MDLKDILSVAIATLIVLVVAHVAVFWVVRTLYPPHPQPEPPVQPQVFTPPPVVEQVQHVDIPTFAPNVPMESSHKEGEPNNLRDIRGPPVQRDAGMDTTVT
jgi:hypothetical protein